MNRSLAIVATLVAIAGGAFWYFGQNPSSVPSYSAAFAQDASQVDTSQVEEMSLGNPDASVTVIEYASFTCPHCKNFHKNAFKDLKKNYIDTGKIHFVYREVYFDRFGLWAGMVARCGGSSKYFGMTDIIYESQSEWTAGGDPALIAGNLRKIGKAAGLKDDQLDACLNDGEMAQALVAEFQKNAENDGINSTPSFMINGEQFANMSYTEFAKVLDDKLGQ